MFKIANLVILICCHNYSVPERIELFDLTSAQLTLVLPLGIVDNHVPCHEGLGGERLLAYRATVLVWKVHQVPVFEHPAVVDKDEVALRALDVVGLLLVDELHMLIEVCLAVGLVPAYVAHELHVVGLLVAEARRK